MRSWGKSGNDAGRSYGIPLERVLFHSGIPRFHRPFLSPDQEALLLRSSLCFFYGGKKPCVVLSCGLEQVFSADPRLACRFSGELGLFSIRDLMGFLWLMESGKPKINITNTPRSGINSADSQTASPSCCTGVFRVRVCISLGTAVGESPAMKIRRISGGMRPGCPKERLRMRKIPQGVTHRRSRRMGIR